MKYQHYEQSEVFKTRHGTSYNVFDQFKYWFFDEFKTENLHRKMAACVEKNSPWHIEGTVAIHVDMVVTEYLIRTGHKRDEWTLDSRYVEGAFACAFHDVGKYFTMQEKESEERGEYVSFPAHEQHSARLWEDWAITNLRLLADRFGITPESIYRVSWMIEHHLPWGVKKGDKLDAMAFTAAANGLEQIFANVLLADTYGRISRDVDEKREKVHAWVDAFLLRCKTSIPKKPLEDAPLLVMPIGASGSGKSTCYDKLVNDWFPGREFAHFSQDRFRHEWYDEVDYVNAFRLSCEDKEFTKKIHVEFMEMLKAGDNIYADNINTSRKSRAHYINCAKQKGYRVIGIPLLISKEVLGQRQSGRSDKVVPPDVVERQYMAVQQPQLGEVHEVWVHDGNLPKLD